MLPRYCTLFLALAATLAAAAAPAPARDWFIHPEAGRDEDGFGASAEKPLATAQVAANRARPGDRIVLLPEDGLYRQSIVFNREQENIVLEGNGVTLTGADPLEGEWEPLGNGLHRIRLPATRWDRHLLIVNGRAERMGRLCGGGPDFPPAKELAEGEFRWDPVPDTDEGWLTVKGPTDRLEWAVRPNGFATGGTVRKVTVRNLRTRHFLNDGFNIHGDARGMRFENIVGLENFDEGFSAHDISQCWIDRGEFRRNENAIADVNFADTYYEDCVFADSAAVEVIFHGGNHVLSRCRILPGPRSIALRVRRGGHPRLPGRISTGNATFRGTVIETEDPVIEYGPNTTLFHDRESVRWLDSPHFQANPNALVARGLFHEFPIGRRADGGPLVARSWGTASRERGNPRRVLDLSTLEPSPPRPGEELFALVPPLPAGPYPPRGAAYQGKHAGTQSLWRWIERLGPDEVILPENETGRALGAALQGRVPVRYRSGTELSAPGTGDHVDSTSPLADEARARAHRTPGEVARTLAEHYGHRFTGSYTQALSLMARLRLGGEDRQDAARIARDHLATSPALPRNGGDIAGTLVHARLDDPASRKRVLAVAGLAFDEQGAPLPAMPTHKEMSDAVFMGGPLLAEAGRISGERRYFDQCLRHVRFIRERCLRPDGLYRHSPLDESAWGRGNGFPALGLVLVLEIFPEDHPGRSELLAAFRAHMAALASHQDAAGMWHQVVDHPESYAEFTCTNMIAFAALRGIRQGWLEEKEWEPRIWRAWQGVLARIGTDGESLADVCTGTGKQKSLGAYLNRKAIHGRDDRGGAMALLFATEMRDWTEME